ncbi:MAG: M56 family metallopeptidase [Clostridia bacterium]|nr:M56 family metallopeptidase [Clostridia bacterium]
MRTALIYNFLIEANIMASIAILLMIPLRKLLRKQLGNSALCFGWLLVAIRLLLPLSLPNPLINAIRSPFAADTAIRPIAGQVKVRLTDAISDVGYRLWSDNHIAAGNRMIDLSWRMDNAQLPILLAKIYIAGVLAVIAWSVFCNVRFRLKLRAGRIEPISGRLLEQYTALCESRGVKPVPVYFTDPLPSACLVGVFRPYIALPLTASPQDVIHVLTHEVCHIKNRDHLWGVVRLACCALHWFNPLVWMAASMSRTDGELRCDDRVIRPMEYEEKRAYANVLVLAAARRNAPGMAVLATGMTMTGRRLKTRVTTILQGRGVLRWLSVSFVMLSSMCLVGAFATGEVRIVPRLFRSHPAISHATITNEQEAINYGKTVLALDGLKVSENDLSWHVETAADDPDECCVYALSGGSIVPVFEMYFDRAGNVKSISAPVDGPDRWNACDISLTEEEQENLAEDLRQFITQINPETAEDCSAYLFGNEAMLDGKRVIDVAFWRGEAARENGYDVAAYLSVQIAPETRVVYYDINFGSLDGNG